MSLGTDAKYTRVLEYPHDEETVFFCAMQRFINSSVPWVIRVSQSIVEMAVADGGGSGNVTTRDVHAGTLCITD